jgi:chromosome segregation ATPase
MKKFLLAIVLAAGLLVFSKAQALIPPLQINHNISPVLLESIQKARCDKITAAMENRINSFEKRKSNHETAYDNLKSRLSTLVSKLDVRGYEVADLKAEISTLGNKVDKLKGDYDAFLSKLNEIKSYACDHTDAEVKVKLGESRALLKTVRNDSNDIHNYFKTVIRPDIAQLSKRQVSN